MGVRGIEHRVSVTGHDRNEQQMETLGVYESYSSSTYALVEADRRVLPS